MPINTVIEILEERKKDGDFTYQQQIALEHSEKFAQTKAHTEKMKKALEALEPAEREVASSQILRYSRGTRCCSSRY